MRATLFLAAAILTAAVLATWARPPAAPLAVRVDAAIARGTAFLLAAQSPDGAWRSRVYGSMRDGPSLTPIALKALVYLDRPEAAPAAARGARYLAALVRGDGSTPGPVGLGYPVYTAAATVMALSKLGEKPARDAWLAELRRFQIAEPGGFAPEDAGYGGFGYGTAPPKKPEVPDANLSATLFAIGAMRAGGVPAGDPAIRKARRFVARCQNFSEEGGAGPLEDGGFFASPVDPTLNKGGPAAPGREDRFASYGSATADGLRALLACGDDLDSPRARAAREWLVANFSARRHPGRFAPEREALRDGYFFYYAWAVAHALVRSHTLEVREGRWAASLADELLAREGPGGAWRNGITDGREDDPIVATCLALGALANCRTLLGSGE